MLIVWYVREELRYVVRFPVMIGLSAWILSGVGLVCRIGWIGRLRLL